MENRTAMDESTEKIRSENQEVKHIGRETAGQKKDAILAEQNAEARGNVYCFLSAVFLRPPKQSLLRHIVAKDFLDELSALFGREALAGLKKFSTANRPKKEAAFLRQDYMDLFAVPTSRYVTPFEDVYREISTGGEIQKGPLIGPQTISVRKIYRLAGAEMSQTCKELPTHIGVELAFMSFLCEREAEAIYNKEGEWLWDQGKMEDMDPIRYRGFQIRFLQDHLNEWFPQLSQLIQANANSHFYRGIALLTEAFLSWDTAGLLAHSGLEHVRVP